MLSVITQQTSGSKNRTLRGSKKKNVTSAIAVSVVNGFIVWKSAFSVALHQPCCPGHQRR